MTRGNSGPSRALVWAGLTVALMTASGLTGGALAAPAKTNYEWYCAQCHGMEGKGDGINSVDELPVGPMDLSAAKEMSKFTSDQIINTLTRGGPVNTLDPLMPPWGDSFTTDEIEELMLYVRSLCKEEGCP